MRKSSIFITFVSVSLFLLLIFWTVIPPLVESRHELVRTEMRQLVRKLDLTDLALFTEARYTRHLSVADIHSAFQDHPMAIEHFPSGSLVLPPVDSWTE